MYFPFCLKLSNFWASLNFPYFVTAGGQSTGKSSLLEDILGIEIFPKGNSMVSRCPLKLVLQNVPSGTYVKFEDGEVYYDMDLVQQRILDENLSIQGVSAEPLTVYVFSDKVNNLTVIDLPGIIENVDESEVISLFTNDANYENTVISKTCNYNKS